MSDQTKQDLEHLGKQASFSTKQIDHIAAEIERLEGEVTKQADTARNAIGKYGQAATDNIILIRERDRARHQRDRFLAVATAYREGFICEYTEHRAEEKERLAMDDMCREYQLKLAAERTLREQAEANYKEILEAYELAITERNQARDEARTIMLESVSARCARTHVQNCTECEQVDCGDNMNEGIVGLKRRAEQAERERDKLIGLNVEFFLNCPPDNKELHLCEKAEAISPSKEKPIVCQTCWLAWAKGE